MVGLTGLQADTDDQSNVVHGSTHDQQFGYTCMYKNEVSAQFSHGYIGNLRAHEHMLRNAIL